MLQLELTPEEQGLLAEVLENFISDLRFEVADTDSMDYREKLKKQEALLKRLLAELHSTHPSQGV